jgi:4-hydroxy-4-methyl-2-oxoglutarate aldolase
VDTRPADNLMLHYALLKARPGDVLVVDAKGFVEAGPWGDVLTAAAMKRGIAGLVIHGAVRDANAIESMGFPVFCRGLSIKGTGKVHPGKVNVPVCIGDVVIRPGDIIVGDRDGVVVVSADEVSTVLESARAREAKEEAFRLAIEQGASTAELLGLMPTLEALHLR